MMPDTSKLANIPRLGCIDGWHLSPCQTAESIHNAVSSDHASQERLQSHSYFVLDALNQLHVAENTTNEDCEESFHHGIIIRPLSSTVQDLLLKAFVNIAAFRLYCWHIAKQMMLKGAPACRQAVLIGFQGQTAYLENCHCLEAQTVYRHQLKQARARQPLLS